MLVLTKLDPTMTAFEFGVWSFEACFGGEESNTSIIRWHVGWSVGGWFLSAMIPSVFKIH